jgi:hypothetical protein
MLKLVLPAMVASLFICSAAYAGTPPASPQLRSSDLVQIKQGGKDHEHNWQGRGGDDWRDRQASRYGPDDRYRGWHHYAYRPDDWGDRGCVAVGPLWYCP